MQPLCPHDRKSPPQDFKALSLKGCSTVRRITCEHHKSASFYSEENMLFFVLEGAITIRCARNTYEINQHKIAFIKRNTLFELEEFSATDAGVNTEYVLFTLTNELVKEFTKLAAVCVNANEESFPVIVSDTQKELHNYMASLEPYIQVSQTVDTNLIRLKVLELLFCLSRLHKDIITHLLDIRDHFRMDITTTVESNITNPITLSELATLSGRSLSSFRRDFAAIYKMPPYQWIRQKKLEKSKELLLSTTMTITDVCYTTGFESVAHFSRLFKLQFGCPPSAFRMNVQA